MPAQHTNGSGFYGLASSASPSTGTQAGIDCPGPILATGPGPKLGQQPAHHRDKPLRHLALLGGCSASQDNPAA